MNPSRISFGVLTLLTFPWCHAGIATARDGQPSPAMEASGALKRADAATRADILRVISATESAFNRRDFDAFMDGYAQTADVEYVFQGRAVRGVEAIRREYAAFFSKGPERDSNPLGSMSLRLVLSELDFVGKDSVVATIGILLRDATGSRPEVRGTSTLILRRLGARWRIVYDHSSVLDDSSSAKP